MPDVTARRDRDRNLRISQDDENQIHTSSDNHWTLHLANDVPLEIKIDMGAGHGNLRLRDIAVTRLNLDMGAGQVDVDLTGDRKWLSYLYARAAPPTTRQAPRK